MHEVSPTSIIKTKTESAEWLRVSRVPRLAPTSLLGLTFSVLLTPLLVVAPTLTRPHAPHARPVAPQLHRLSLAGVDRSAWARLGASASAKAPLVLTGEQATTPFSLVGITWDGRDAKTPVDVQVRTRTGGQWTGWHDLEGLDDVEADPGSKDALSEGERAGTAPYWVGPSDGVQVRVDGARAPRALRVDLIDPGASAADATAGHGTAPASSASAAVSQPTIVSRAGWGADESLRSGTPDYAAPIKVGFVHHTDTTNSYTAAQSASIVRSVYAYHTKSRGWSDIGYNFLIDKYGTVFEGRAGGIDKAVVGAHTGGFNSHSFAASLMGNYATAQPSSAMLGALQKLFAWKFGLSYLNPVGSGTLVSAGGGTARYSAGTAHTFNVVSGHRDAGYTTCPGSYVYSKLATIRSGIKALMGPSFVTPSVSPTSRGLLDPGNFTVSAGAVNPVSWTLTVTEATTGLLIRKLTGTASPTVKVSAAWNGLDSQAVKAPPGRYSLRLDGTSADGKTARTWSTTVTITSPVTITAPALAGWGSTVPVTGSAPPSSQVTLETMKAGTTTWQPGATTRADAKGAFSTSFVLDDDYTVRATSSGYPSAVRRVAVAPVFTVPADVLLGDALTVIGTARPGSAVTLKAKRPASASWTTSRNAVADTAGAWTALLPMNGDWSLAAVADGVTTPTTTVWVRPTLMTGSTYIGALGSAIPLTGTAAPGGLVSLQVRPAGATGWTSVATAAADTTGNWTGAAPLSDDLDVRAVSHGRASTETQAARVRPSASAPASAPWNSSVPLTGTARPGAAVTVSRTVGAITTTVTTTASSAGRWSSPFVIDSTTTWTATAGGLTSDQGVTRVAPTLALPTRSVVGRVGRAVGTARPGSAVVLAIQQPGSGAFQNLAAVTASSSGSWTTTYTATALGAASLRAVSGSVYSPVKVLPVVPVTVTAPASSTVGALVHVTGVSRPSTFVRVEVKKRTATAWTAIATVKSDGAGLWRATYSLRDDTRVRGVSADGAAVAALTKVGPTLTVPASAKLGSTITFRGTARPGATVVVYVRYASESAGTARRSAVATATGGWAVSWPFQRWIASYAVSNGLRSVTRVTAAQ
ncbi:MAG: hypothetical protein QOJ92_136 [Frankiales bacterium]|nr:hypothetical protein [Frankiales bacterium]